MKLFALYSNVLIPKKPDWLDGFRQKYDADYEAHITFTQPRFIAEEDIQHLKTLVENFLKNNSLTSTKMTFSEQFLDRQDATNDGCIMVAATEYNELLGFQKRLNACLKEFDNYYDAVTKKYEDNLIPHITVGRNLSQQQLDEALQKLPPKPEIKAEFPEIILAIVSDKSAEERKNPKNLIIYPLSSVTKQD